MAIVTHFAEDWKTAGLKERIFMVCGAIFLVAAIIVIFLPVIPQVPFALASGYCFSKGSPSIHQWIRDNKHLGQPVRDWEDHRAIRPKLKIFSVLGLLFVAGVAHYKLEPQMALIADTVLFVFILFVLTRKTSARGPILKKN